MEVRCRWCMEAESTVDPPVVADVRVSSPCQRKTLPRFEPLLRARVTILNSAAVRWLWSEKVQITTFSTFGCPRFTIKYSLCHVKLRRWVWGGTYCGVLLLRYCHCSLSLNYVSISVWCFLLLEQQ